MRSNQTFQQAMAVLHQTTESFKEGTVSSVAHSYARGAALCAAIVGMAKSLGATIDHPICIDSRGELSITSSKDTDQYGKRFSDWLNSAAPRQGVIGIAILHETSRWCFINHFAMEDLLYRFEKETKNV